MANPRSSQMQRLWAPWREAYLTRPMPRGCVFCLAKRRRDGRKSLVVHRGMEVFCLLNLYPYNNGHALVAPYRHVRSLAQLTDREAADLIRTTALMEARLRRLLRPQGFNVGINLGRVAGAGIPGHLHLHLVPRWKGDTNFMPVTGQTKVISVSLETLARELRRAA